jgi:formylmethanofuran dehydrogenase subunit E-like metal-binding protein
LRCFDATRLRISKDGSYGNGDDRKEIFMCRLKLGDSKKTIYLLVVIFLMIAGLMFTTTVSARDCKDDYSYWQSVGRHAAKQAFRMIRGKIPRISTKNFIVMTNAGYVQSDGGSTTGALDGLSRSLGVSRGDHSLVEIQSTAEKPLWFAVYHQRSGYCAYLEVAPDAMVNKHDPDRETFRSIFSTSALEQINAMHLYDNAKEYAQKFDSGIFGGNEFRIVTIANAIAEGAPTFAVRSFEFHDHYCPGVTSGIIMALYIRRFFPLEPGGSYFVQSVQPWCKEDALLTMLNTTPGKRGYAVTYPTKEDIAAWPEWAENASTVVYRKDPNTGNWDGLVLGFVWGETDCPEYGHSVMDKLCSDLWYLDRLDQPKDYIKALKKFNLPAGVDPKSYARPGVDAILILNQLN